MRFAWHGNATVSLVVAGQCLAVDPFFSPAGTYGPWYVPNPSGMTVDGFLAGFAPDLVIITHGHWDHFDLEAVARIEAAVRPRYVATGEAVAVLTGPPIHAAPDRCHVLEPGRRLDLPGGLALAAFRGEHWFTGEEGTAAARKLAHRYGAMPCGGAMLQLVITGPDGSAYVSGDTLPGPVPALGGVDLAVVTACNPVPHPVTKVPTQATVGPADLPAVVERVRPRHLTVVHWDYPLQNPPLTAAELEAAVAGLPVTLHLPPYHTWVEVA